MWTILVMAERWVLAGKLRPHPANALVLVLDQCHTIRNWGTTNGVGQLGLTGPTESTSLDPEGDGVEITRHYVMRAITCTPEAAECWTARTCSSGATGSKTPVR